MTPTRMGGIVVAALIVLALGVLLGSRLTQSNSATSPPATVIVVPTAIPTETPAPTPTAIPVPKGLGAWYYQHDAQNQDLIGLQYAGGRVVAHLLNDPDVTDPSIIRNAMQGTWQRGTLIYTGALIGDAMLRVRVHLDTDAPGTDHTLTIKVAQPGQANITIIEPAGDTGATGSTRHFTAICGLPTDAYRYLSCRPLTKP